MGDRCQLFWSRFVACQVNARNAKSQGEKTVWLQVAEMWLTMARAEQIVGPRDEAAQLPN
jgi:hypothetical protein